MTSEIVELRTVLADGESWVSMSDLVIFIDQWAENITHSLADRPHPQAAALSVLKNLKTTIRTLEERNEH